MTLFNYPERIEKIRRIMKQENIEIILCTRLQSVAYFGGVFAPLPWRAGIIIPQNGEVQFISMGADYERMKEETWINSFLIWDRTEPMSFIDRVMEALKELNFKEGKIALEMRLPMVAGLLSVPEYFSLKENLPDTEFIDGVDFIDSIMVIKEPNEIVLIRRAAEIADLGLQEAFKSLKVGVTENEVAGVAELALRKAGSSWAWAETGGTEVGSGERSAFLGGVCQPATNKLIKDGETIVVDVHSMYELYLCDTCGTAVLKSPSPEQVKLGRAWVRISQEVVNNLKAGNKIGDVARAGLAMAEELGYLKNIVKTFGHGLGTCVGGLAPFIWEGNQEILKSSTVVIVLSSIAVPGVGGVRLELPVLVNEDTPEVLSKLPLGLTIIS